MINHKSNHRPFTLRVFFPSGNPNGMRLIDDNNWTGRALCISRDEIGEPQNFKEAEFENQPGVYLLVGDIDQNADESEFQQKIYIGETDDLPKRLKEHAHKTSGKDFWHFAIAFGSSKGALSRAHCLWLEHKLIGRARSIKRCTLENGDSGSKAKLTKSEIADCDFFLEKIYQILPLAGIQAFEAKPERIVSVETSPVSKSVDYSKPTDLIIPDTIVVPARDDGFESVFLAKNCWYSVRISKDRIPDLKYIAGYRVGKIKAVTHYAKIKDIVPYGDEGKYKLNFDGVATKLDKPIKFAPSQDSSLQASRYTRFDKLGSSENLSQLFDLETPINLDQMSE